MKNLCLLLLRCIILIQIFASNAIAGYYSKSYIDHHQNITDYAFHQPRIASTLINKPLLFTQDAVALQMLTICKHDINRQQRNCSQKALQSTAQTNLKQWNTDNKTILFYSQVNPLKSIKPTEVIINKSKKDLTAFGLGGTILVKIII